MAGTNPHRQARIQVKHEHASLLGSLGRVERDGLLACRRDCAELARLVNRSGLPGVAVVIRDGEEACGIERVCTPMLAIEVGATKKGVVDEQVVSRRRAVCAGRAAYDRWFALTTAR